MLRRGVLPRNRRRGIRRRMSAFYREQVTTVHHWTDTLFTLTTTRDPGLRFRSGEFVMIGIEVNGKPLLRAYSIVSATWEEQLEFLSIKVPDGPLTSRLQHIQPGDTLLVGRKSTGTLLLDNLRPGRTLFMLSTGTGLAPFMSLVKDPETYARFDRVVLTHTCRFEAELAYRDWLTTDLPAHELLGEEAAAKLVYYPTVTREPFARQGRITDLIADGTLFRDLGREGGFDRGQDRVMLCGSPEMLRDTRAMMEALGFEEGNSGEPGDFVIEKAFVEK